MGEFSQRKGGERTWKVLQGVSSMGGDVCERKRGKVAWKVVQGVSKTLTKDEMGEKGREVVD